MPGASGTRKPRHKRSFCAFIRGLSSVCRKALGSEERTTELQTDGYLLWRAEVAEPKEMLPWVRGWGADCEVLEPLSLKEELVKKCVRLAELYQISDKQGEKNYGCF